MRRVLFIVAALAMGACAGPTEEELQAAAEFGAAGGDCMEYSDRGTYSDSPGFKLFLACVDGSSEYHRNQPLPPRPPSPASIIYGYDDTDLVRHMENTIEDLTFCQGLYPDDGLAVSRCFERLTN